MSSDPARRGVYTSQDSRYCYPNSATLKNLGGYRDARELAEWEAHVVAIRSAEVVRQQHPFDFTFEFVCQLHRSLFRDVYEWAGKTRQVDISKGDTRFAVWGQIESEAQRLFERTAKGPDADEADLGRWFVQAAAPFLIELNVIHPFREGNGRTMRLFVELWANTVGQSVAWDNVGPDEVIEAMVHGVTADSGLLESVLARCLRPVA